MATSTVSVPSTMLVTSDPWFRAYARRQGIALSTVYFRMQQLVRAIQQHPWFDEITSHFRPVRRPA